jgi:hypothetical protein
MNFRNKSSTEGCLTKFIELIINKSEQDATFAHPGVTNDNDLYLW